MPKSSPRRGNGALRLLAGASFVILAASSAWALHRESPGAYRITSGSSHAHPPTRSWGNYFAFASSDDLTGTGNNRREIFVFNVAYYDCFNGTTFPATPCRNPIPPFLWQATNGPGEPDNPSLGQAFDSSNPPDGVDDVQWLAFDALGNYAGGTGLAASHRQIFMKNLRTNEVRQLTFGTDGDSTRPNVSSLGGMVVFQSTARLTNGPSAAGVSQIYAYETPTRILRQLTNGAAPSINPIPNNNGTLIAFQSTADLLRDGAATGVSQIFWADYDKATHTSVVRQLTDGNGDSKNPYISEFSSFIVFESVATDFPGTLGAAGSSIYMSTPLQAQNPPSPTLRQLTSPSDFGNCIAPMVDTGTVADHIGFICDGDPLANATVGNRVFVLELSSLTLFQLTGTGDVQPPIGGNLGAWFVTLSTTGGLTGLGSCGYQLYFIDYWIEAWPAATQRGQLPPDSLAAPPGGSSLLGLRQMKVMPGDGTVGSRVAITTGDGAWSGGPPIGGALRLVMGAPDEFTGEAPVRVAASFSSLPPVSLPGLGTACLEFAADGTGRVDCDGGAQGNLVVRQDHMTDDTNPACVAPGCREDAACQGALHGPHRLISTLCPTCGSSGTCVDGPNAGQTCASDTECGGAAECVNGMLATCNGPVSVAETGSVTPGAMMLSLPLRLSLSTSTGGDGKYCTGDDSYTAINHIPVDFRLTTGSVSGAIVDRDAVAGSALDVSDLGTHFDCNRIRANDLGGAVLTGVLPMLDVPNMPSLRDLLVSVRLQALPPELGCTPQTSCSASSECNDGNSCNGAEECINGTCVPGPPRVCDDGDPCNGIDTCDPTSGACVPGPPCDDGDPCNGTETCDQTNGCQAGTPIDCLDGDACNGAETCNPADGSCLPGTPLDCEDNNPCTADGCDSATGCFNDPIPAPCDDSDACTSGDTCLGGICVGTPAVVCDDGNACNGIESCNPFTGSCMPGSPPVCDDGNPCTDDICDNSFGCLFVNNDALACSDGSLCTTGDACVAGACVGTPLSCDDGLACNGVETCNPLDGTCSPGTAPSCDDGNPCTTDSCDDSLGCQYLPNSDPCDDGNNCTSGDVCTAGVCLGTALACDDGNFCNGVELCDPLSGTCSPGLAPDCDDGDSCTSDSCDALAGICVNVLGSGGALCVLANMTFQVSGADPIMLGGARRQTRLLHRLNNVRTKVMKAQANAARARRAYGRAYNGMVKFKRAMTSGAQNLNFDITLSSQLIGMSDTLMTELAQLKASSI